MAVTTDCATSHHFQNLVVWNQTDQPERVAIAVDGIDLYTGVLGTVDSFPRIVRTQTLAFPAGPHVLSVTVPGRRVVKQVTFVVDERPVNLHVMINRDEIQVGVTYGPEAYL